MKLSSADQPKPPQPKSILITGAPGSRKTTLALQFPKVYLLDCDLNLDGPERYLRKEAKMNLSYGYDTIPLDDSGNPVEPWKCYERLMDKLTLAKTLPDIEWVVIDSLTLINEYIIRKVLKEKNSSEMEARHWQPFKSACYELIVSKLRNLGKNCIVIAHETDIERSDPKNVMQKVLVQRRPYIQGGINEQLGGFFTDMWRMDVQPAPAGRTECKLYCQRTTFDELKSSCGMPDCIVEPTYAKLEPYLKGTK